MTRVLVLYYSGYGHIHEMAAAAAAGAGEVAGTEVALKRVPETIPEDVRRRAGYRDFDTPEARVAELADYDAIILGTPTRFGNMAAQMKQFIDQAGGLWAANALVGKVGSVFTSTASQHGGHEAAILATQIPLLHLGMVVVGLPYTFTGQTRVDRITGGSPYGAGTVAGAEGELRPTETDLDGARFQGRHVAGIAARLAERAPQPMEA
ncbi:MAG: NAD(P)H:quinone oxidoreductase [Pseudomonadota bacterium]